MDPVMDICHRHGLQIIEDSAEQIGVGTLFQKRAKVHDLVGR